MSVSGRPRIFLVEDHPLMLTGIRSALEGQYEIVGAASEVVPAIDMILERRPDLVLLDVRIPGGGGAMVVEEVRRRDQDVKFVAFTVSTRPEDVVRMLQVGVDGYVVKKADSHELADHIDLALDGGFPVSRYVANYAMQIDDVAAAHDELESLTPKEREVMIYVARGFRNREIAEELGISVKTLETHMKHIFDKLGVASRHEVIYWAFLHGIVDPDRGQDE
jgi:DNA-binding NarL/FixJ family response regulator